MQSVKQSFNSEFNGFEVSSGISGEDQPFRKFLAGLKFTPAPDQLYDELLAILPGNQFKVVCYIIRRTLGRQKLTESVSLRQMMQGLRKRDGTQIDRGVGLSKPTLLKALNALIDKGIISRQQVVEQGRGAQASRYALVFAQVEAKQVQPAAAQVKEVDPPGQKSSPAPLEADPGKSSLPGGGKETLPTERNMGKETLKNVVEKIRQSGKPQIPTKPPGKVDYLVSEMERRTGDTHSRGSFTMLASALPETVIYQTLSEVEQSADIKNRGALFTHIVKQKISAAAIPI